MYLVIHVLYKYKYVYEYMYVWGILSVHWLMRDVFYPFSQAGLAGEDAPSAVFPTLVGRPRHRVSETL